MVLASDAPASGEPAGPSASDARADAPPQPTPPAPRRGPVAAIRRWTATRPAAAPLATLAAGAVGAAYLYQTNPHESGHWLPRCPFNWVTGLLCPACGVSRLCYDLLHGDIPAAFADNRVLFVLGLPAAAYWYARWLYEGLRGRAYRPAPGRRGIAVILTIAVAWSVVRNVAG